jgi:hypothetical protein
MGMPVDQHTSLDAVPVNGEGRLRGALQAVFKNGLRLAGRMGIGRREGMETGGLRWGGVKPVAPGKARFKSACTVRN